MNDKEIPLGLPDDPHTIDPRVKLTTNTDKYDYIKPKFEINDDIEKTKPKVHIVEIKTRKNNQTKNGLF